MENMSYGGRGSSWGKRNTIINCCKRCGRRRQRKPNGKGWFACTCGATEPLRCDPYSRRLADGFALLSDEGY